MAEIKEGVSEYEDDKIDKKNKSSTDTNSLLNSAKQEFIDDGLSRGGDFLDIQDEHFDIVAFDKFQVFLEGKDRYSILATQLAGYVPESKKSVSSQLKQELIKGSIKIDKNRNTLKDLIEEEYEIKSGDKIEKNIKKLKSSDTQELINSELKRKKFIEKNYKQDQFKSINKDEELDKKINIEGIKFENLSEDQKEAIEKFSNKNYLSPEEYFILLSIFSKKEKIIILKHFNNSFKLSDLLKFGVIDKVKAYRLLEKSIKKTYPRLSKSEIEKYKPSLEGDTSLLNEINISLKELESIGTKTLDNLVDNEKALFNFYNSLNEASQKEYKIAQGDLNEYLSLDENGNIHNNFKDFIGGKINSGVVRETVRNTINNFSEGNYLKVNNNGEEGYYYIEAVDLGKSVESKQIKVKDLKSPFGEGLINPQDASSELWSYEKIYNVFKKSEEYKKQGKDSSIEFVDKKAFNENVDNGDLELNDGVNNISSEADLKKKLVANGNLSESDKNIPLIELCFLDDVHEKGELKFHRSFQAVTNNSLVFEGSNQNMDFSAFFAEIKKGGKGKYKFKKKILSISDITEKGPLENIVLHKDGKKLVLKSDRYESNAQEIDYFVTSAGNTAIKIEKISENGIEYSIGDLKTKTDKEELSEKELKKGKKPKIKKITKTFSSKNGFGSFNDFLEHLNDKEKGYSPDTEGKTIETKKDKEKEDIINSKGSLAGKIFRNASILEVIQGGTMMIDGIKEHFEHGNKLKAAKFAEKFGKILPDTISTKLRSRAEKETNELIGERIDMWKVMGSDVATKDIERNILLNRYAEDHEILAAMQYMVEKNGTLYSKALAKYRPSAGSGYSKHLWFRKLGGTKEQFEKEKIAITKSDPKASASGRDDPEIFSEEKLVMSILSNGAKNKRFPSKIHKDFWGKVEEGHKKRMEKGVEETSAYYTAADKVDYTLTYLAKGEASRFIGAMEKTLGKDSDKYSMNVMPFVLGMSGASSTWHNMQIKELHRLDGTTAYPTLEMMKSQEGIKLYQDSIYTYLKESGNKEALNRLEKIKSKSLANQIYGEGDNLHKFFMDYKEILTNFITLQDGFAATRRYKNPILGEYYDRIKAKFTDKEYSLNQDSLNAESTYVNSGLADTGAKIDDIKVNQALEFYGVKEKRVNAFYLERLKQIKNLPSIEENSKIGITEDERKKLFLNVFTKYEAQVTGVVGGMYSKYEENDDLNTFYKSKIGSILYKNNILLSLGKHSNKNISTEQFNDLAYECYMNPSKYQNEILLNTIDSTVGGTGDIIDALIKAANNDKYTPREKKVA